MSSPNHDQNANLSKVNDEAENNYDSSEEDNQFTTPYQVYRRLVDIVNNESLLDDLLPYEETVIDCILDQMHHMNSSLEKFGSHLSAFCVEQHRIELERFAFIANKYYRTRLTKIEARASELIHLLKTNRRKAYKLLSLLEIKYLDNYASSIDNYLTNELLNLIPENVKRFKLTDIPSPTLDNDYVFVKSTKQSSVRVDDPVSGEEIIDTQENGEYLLPYVALKYDFQKGTKWNGNELSFYHEKNILILTEANVVNLGFNQSKSDLVEPI